MTLKTWSTIFNQSDAIGQVVTMIGIALVSAMLIMFALDREPPFKLISYTTTPVAAGQQLQIREIVKRDLGRECSAKYSKVMYDASGSRFWSTPPEYSNSAGIEILDHLAPDELKLTVEVPYWAPSGKMEYVTNLDYVCNPLHYIWPIEVVVRIQTEVKASK